MAKIESKVATTEVQPTARSRAEGEPRLDSGGTMANGPARTVPRVKPKDENRTRASAGAKAVENARLKAAEAKTAEEARATAARKAREEEEAQANAEIEALAEEEARVAALVRERAERKAKAKAESERWAADQARLAAASQAKARNDAKSGATGEASRLANPNEEIAEPTNVDSDTFKTEDNPADTTHARDAAGHTPATEAAATETTVSPLLKKTWPPRSSTRRVWYYTCEGDRLGPVSLDELRKRAADALLDPRLDMVWKKGMDEWTPAGRINGLFDHSNEPPKTRQLVANPTVPLQPTQRIYPTKSRIKLTWPGTRRRSLLLATLVFPIAWKLALVAISPFLTKQFGIILMEKILPLAALTPLAVLVHFGLQRLMNLGMSRWWLLAACVPGLNLWLGYRCLACPPGFACHKKLDGPGIALAALYWISMAAVSWMLIFNPAKLAALVGNPLLQKQLRSATFKN